MSGEFLIHFTDAEQTAQGLLQDAQMLHDVMERTQRAAGALLSGGLQGAFLDDFQARCRYIEDRLRYLADETDETGRDLQTVVEWARQLDNQCAALFNTYSASMLAGIGRAPVAGGNAAPRTQTIDESITRLQTIRAALLAQQTQIDQVLIAPWSGTLIRMFGLRDDYEDSRNQLQESVIAVDARIAELQAEQAQLQQLRAHIAGLGQYVHSQQDSGDPYGCTLYAQASALEAMGYTFDQELTEGKALGAGQGWFNPASGSKPDGIGALFADNGLAPEVFRSEPDPNIEPILAAQQAEQNASTRLQNAIKDGQYAIVNVTGGMLGSGTAVNSAQVHTYSSSFGGHSIWVTDIRYDDAGNPVAIVANDSWWGEAVEYDFNNFMNAWENHYDYNAAFVTPKQGGE